jgi:hypothetical protein
MELITPEEWEKLLAALATVKELNPAASVADRVIDLVARFKACQPNFDCLRGELEKASQDYLELHQLLNQAHRLIGSQACQMERIRANKRQMHA